MKTIETYEEFWPFYVREHSRPLTRAMHFVGTALGILMLVWFAARGMWLYTPLCFVVGYAFAWFSHFAIEKNRPATFKYPLWSFISDYKMMFYMLAGKMNREVERVSNKN